MIFSSSNVTAYMKQAASPYNYFIRQGLILIIGFILFIIMINFNTRAYGILSYLFQIGIIGILVATLISGLTSNQAKSWLDFGYFNFQPSEFAKVISIVFLSYFYDKKKKQLNNWKVVLFPLFICAIIAVLIFVQPDLGTTIIYVGLCALIFLAEPIPRNIKFKIVGSVVGILALAFVILTISGKSLILERQLERFNFLRPCDRLLDDGNQVCNGYIAMNNGGLWGKGLGNSTQKYLYLPEPYTDFIFAVMVEELGGVVGISLMLAYILVLYRILKIGRLCNTNRGCMLCYGTALYIVLHIFVNLLGILGLMPMTGVPLPFMSYGGSFTICLITALTIVQRVSVENGLGSEFLDEEKPKVVKRTISTKSKTSSKPKTPVKKSIPAKAR